MQPTYSTWRCKTKQCAFGCGLGTTSLGFWTHGLDQNSLDPIPSSSSVGSLGYVSPEANESGELIQEADVYSFGRVLLQLPTGRRPAVFNVQDEDIAKWGQRMLQLGEITKVFDSPFRRKNWQVRSRHHGPMTSNFQKIKGSFFSHNCRSEKTKRIAQRT